jgi:hypothetical protein
MDRDQDAGRAQDARPADTPLSFTQREAWLHARLATDVPAGNEPVAFHCPVGLDVAALEAAFADLLRRHAAWRTSVGTQDGRPVAVVAAPGPVYLPEVDLRGVIDGEAEARALARADAVRGSRRPTPRRRSTAGAGGWRARRPPSSRSPIAPGRRCGAFAAPATRSPSARG